MLRSQTLTVARVVPIQFLAHWLFTPRRDTLRRMIKIANSGVVNFISWHRAEFRPARGRSISSSGGTAAASVGSDVRFVTKTAKPSARESAGGFAFVPPTCRMGRRRRAKQKWCSAAAAFLRRQNAELQTPRCEIGSAPRSVTLWLQTQALLQTVLRHWPVVARCCAFRLKKRCSFC